MLHMDPMSIIMEVSPALLQSPGTQEPLLCARQRRNPTKALSSRGLHSCGDCVLRITLSVLHGYLIPLHPSRLARVPPSLRSLPSSPLCSGVDVLPSGSLPTPSAQTDYLLLSLTSRAQGFTLPGSLMGHKLKAWWLISADLPLGSQLEETN